MDKKIEDIPSKYQPLVSDLLKEITVLKNEVILLKEQLNLFLHRKYSSNADNLHPGTRLLFNEAEEELRKLKEESPEKYQEIQTLRDGIRCAVSQDGDKHFVFCPCK